MPVGKESIRRAASAGKKTAGKAAQPKTETVKPEEIREEAPAKIEESPRPDDRHLRQAPVRITEELPVYLL